MNLYGFDTAQLLRDLAASPAPGLGNVAEACLSGGGAALASGCAGYLFFDGVHITTAGHALLARQFGIAALPEPGTLPLCAAGSLLLGTAGRRGAGRARRPAPRQGVPAAAASGAKPAGGPA